MGQPHEWEGGEKLQAGRNTEAAYCYSLLLLKHRIFFLLRPIHYWSKTVFLTQSNQRPFWLFESDPRSHKTHTWAPPRGRKASSPAERVPTGTMEGNKAVFWLYRESRCASIAAIRSDTVHSTLPLYLKTSEVVSCWHLPWITDEWYVSSNPFTCI